MLLARRTARSCRLRWACPPQQRQQRGWVEEGLRRSGRKPRRQRGELVCCSPHHVLPRGGSGVIDRFWLGVDGLSWSSASLPPVVLSNQMPCLFPASPPHANFRPYLYMQLARFQHRVAGDPASARTTFRAAVADIPGSRELWLAFLEFEASQPQVGLSLCLYPSEIHTSTSRYAVYIYKSYPPFQRVWNLDRLQAVFAHPFPRAFPSTVHRDTHQPAARFSIQPQDFLQLNRAPQVGAAQPLASRSEHRARCILCPQTLHACRLNNLPCPPLLFWI